MCSSKSEIETQAGVLFHFVGRVLAWLQPTVAGIEWFDKQLSSNLDRVSVSVLPLRQNPIKTCTQDVDAQGVEMLRHGGISFSCFVKV